MAITFAEWLHKKFIQWEQERGRRGTVTEFARYLGLSQQLLSSYMSGAYVPKGEKLGLIAEKLGAEAYDVMGLPRPGEVDDLAKWIIEQVQSDPRLREMVASINKLPERQRHLMMEITLQAVALMADGDEATRMRTEDLLQDLRGILAFGK
jgi:transcriptional regulator with XRE-family HTH domain